MKRPILTDRQCVEVLRAMGDVTRLRIVESLLVAEKCVTDLVKDVRRGQPQVSHHLGILRAAGLVEGLRCGKRICYRITPQVQRVMKQKRCEGLDFGCCQLSFPTTRLTASFR